MENSQVKMNGDAGSIEAWQKMGFLKPAEWLGPSDFEILKLQLQPRVEPSHLVRSSLFLSVSEFLEELTEKTDPIQPLVDLIQEACRKLLELPEDWDEEGSPGYSKDTCERATRFLLNHARWFWNRHGIIVDAPRIVAGPHGSIDIYWKDENAELLLNVPADPRKSITCYGDSKSGFKVGGPLKDSDYRRALWSWLMEENKQLDESSR
jgi:hypothetical protein